MRAMLICLFLLSLTAHAERYTYTYEGLWVATNRPMEGVMTAVVTSMGHEKWQGRFYGVWQGVNFDYTVDFTGPAHALRGTSTIDGAPYEWRGWISKKRFIANFGGGRYSGSFELKVTATPNGPVN